MAEIEITEEWIARHEVEDGPVLQARVNAGDSILHIQGYGGEDNRPYGYAEKFYVPHEMTEWLRQKTATHISFASPTEAYIRGVTIVQYTDGVQLIIDGEGGNHTQGNFVLDMNTDSSKVKQLLDFVNNNDLLTVVNENRWVAE